VTLVRSAAVPKAYITKGVRKGANLELTVRNTTATANTATLSFEAHANETAGASMMDLPMSLPARKDTTLLLPIGDGYEYQGAFTLGSELTDEVYLADGNWGLDRDASLTHVQSFEARNNPARVYAEDEYPLYRDVELKATTSDYVSIYKALSPGTEPTDVTAYKSLKFWAKGSGKAEIVLTKDSIAAFKSQYRKVIDLNPEGAEYSIALEDFSSSAVEGSIHANDLKTMVMTFAPDAGADRSVDFKLSAASFSKQGATVTKGYSSESVSIAPNPATDGHFNVTFSSEADRDVTLQLTDITGRIIYTQQVQAAVGTNTVAVTLSEPMPAMSTLLLNLKAENRNYLPMKIQVK
jgi:hypothetical protein